MKKSHSIKIALGVGVSLVLLGWLAFAANWSQVAAELNHINYWYLMPVTVVLFVHLWLRAFRWRYLLSGGEDVPVMTLFESFMIGNFATYVLPLRAGEFLRPAALTFLTGLPFSKGFASVVIERFFDLATVLVTFAIVAGSLTGLPPWVAQGAYSLGVIALMILVFIVSGALLPQFTTRIVRTGCSFIPSSIRNRIQSFLISFIESAGVLRGAKSLVIVLALTGIVWWTNYLFYQLSFPLCGLEGSLWHGAVVGVVLALAVAAPSAPGFVGVYQTACLAVFTLFGLSVEQAMAYAIVTHAYQFIVVLLLGFLTLAKHNISLSTLKTQKA